MSEKYIDLIHAIESSDSMTGCERVTVEAVLAWLDSHPDQVPRRTITESEILRVAMEHESIRDLVGMLGFTVVPDPELPTEPGSVVRTRGDGEDYTLGRDLNWRYGRSVVQPADLRQLDWEVVA